MNNFELHEQATTLEDTLTPHALARCVVELEALYKEDKVFKESLLESYGYLIDALEFQGIDIDDVVRVYEEHVEEHGYVQEERI